MSGATSQIIGGKWVDGAPDNPANRKSDTQQILEAIAALAAGLTARDRQLDALSEQVRQGFKEQISHQIHYFKELETAINGLESKLDTFIDALNALAAEFENFESKLAEIDSRTVNQWAAVQIWQDRALKAERAAAPKQKQWRKGKRK